jgi:hypothetical protein
LKKITKNKFESVSLAEKIIPSRPIYLTIALLWIAYLYMTLNSPDSSQNVFNISKQIIDFLRLTIALPFLFIWLAAAYSYIKIKRYAVAISPSKEAAAFQLMATGIIIFMVSMVLSALISGLRTYYVNFADLRPVLTILTNYTYVWPYLLAFILLLKSSLELSRQQISVKIPLISFFIYGIPILLLAYIWLEWIFTNQNRVIPPIESSFASYYLKDSLLVLTIVIPSLITWIIGALAIFKLRSYYHKVKGVIYKQALSSIIYGLIGVITTSIILQALLSLGSRRLTELGLTSVLGVVYLFLITQGLAFFFMARGANNLTKIESV